MSDNKNKSEAEKTTSYADFKTVARFHMRWMKSRFILFIASLSLIIFSIYELNVDGLNLGIDFRGGVLVEVGFEQAPASEELRNVLKDKSLPAVNVQSFGEKEFLINIGGDAISDPNAVVQSVKAVLTENYADNVSYRRVETVGPKVGGELISTSILAVSLAIGAMLLYIWMRFELPFAVGSVVALAHDVLITLGIFALFNIEFGLPIIAALLTIVGYSMNDTVVTYDRIRENLVTYRRAALADIIDLSINETLARTFVTSFTTLLALVSLLLFGGPVIQPFIIAMTIGVVIGTYSSIFVAAPILLFFGVENKFRAPQKKKKKTQSQMIL